MHPASGDWQAYDYEYAQLALGAAGGGDGAEPEGGPMWCGQLVDEDYADKDRQEHAPPLIHVRGL